MMQPLFFDAKSDVFTLRLPSTLARRKYNIITPKRNRNTNPIIIAHVMQVGPVCAYSGKLPLLQKIRSLG